MRVLALFGLSCFFSNTPPPSPPDPSRPSYVAKYVDGRLDALVQDVRTLLLEGVRSALDVLKADASDALCIPAEHIRYGRQGAARTPGMESFLLGGLKSLLAQTNPREAKAQMEARLGRLRALVVDGDAAAAAVAQMLANLGKVSGDAAALGGAADRALADRLLWRRLAVQVAAVRSQGGVGGALLPRTALPVPVGAVDYDSSQPELAAASEHMPAVAARLAALPTPLTVCATAGQPRGSLWAALAHVVFKPMAIERDPLLLRAAVLERLRRAAAPPSHALAFLRRHDVTAEAYVAARLRGDAGAGFLELQAFCDFYRLQVLVWVASAPQSVALLVRPAVAAAAGAAAAAAARDPAARHIVLADSAGGEHRFEATAMPERRVTHAPSAHTHSFEMNDGERVDKQQHWREVQDNVTSHKRARE